MEKLKMGVQLALRALGRNRFRTFLTMLGIIIGIGSVMIIIGAGQSAKKLILAQLEDVGATLIQVNPGGIGAMPGSESDVLTSADLDAAKSPGAFQYIPSSDVFGLVSTSVTAKAGDKLKQATLVGIPTNYDRVYKMELEKGRKFTSIEEKAMKKVVLLGSKIKTDLFGEQDALGKTIAIDNQTFSIIGILIEKGGFAGQDSWIIAPFLVVQKQIIGINYMSEIDFLAVDTKSIALAKQEVDDFFARRHKITGDKEKDYLVTTAEDSVAITGTVLNVFTLFLSFVAGIALLVGGIGIMNIMLVSVTERTKEIGLRKAIGAKYKDILSQFLIESIVLTCLGGSIGILFGLGGTKLLEIIAVKFVKGWVFILPVNAIILAFTICGAIGVVFGYLPAKRAAKLDPIIALKSD